jgi:hypothetical protein
MKRKFDPDKRRQFSVTYKYSEYRTVTIEARSIEDAKDICEDEYGYEDDFEIDSVEPKKETRAA